IKLALMTSFFILISGYFLAQPATSALAFPQQNPAPPEQMHEHGQQPAPPPAKTQPPQEHHHDAPPSAEPPAAVPHDMSKMGDEHKGHDMGDMHAGHDMSAMMSTITGGPFKSMHAIGSGTSLLPSNSPGYMWHWMKGNWM